MSKTEPIIFLSAAEASGDLHAANLIHAIKRRCPLARFVGAGGPRMQQAGCELLVDLTEKAEMLGGPILRMRYWLRTIKMLKQKMREFQADIHIPVDSPALNWHLAAGAKEAGIPVFYFIAPQVWAWAPWRVKKIRRLTDHVACILPFEQRYLRDRGVTATYVGHPLFDHLPPRKDPPADLAKGWYEGSWNMVFAPGSRPGELKGNVPAFLEVARKVKRRYGKTRCLFTVANQEAADDIRAVAGEQDVEIVAGKTPEILSEAHFALAKSGTVTLEAAWYGVPMVIPYRTSRLLSVLNRLLGRWFVKTPSFSLVNILAGRRIVPEIMPWHGSAKVLTRMVLEVMDDLGYLYETRQKLLNLVTPLRAGPPRTACDNAADLACELIGL